MMEDSLCQRNISKSGFDSFEIDDGFLLEIDAEVKKNRKDVGSGKDEKEKVTNDINSSLNFEDLNDSDFLNSNVKIDTEISSKTSQHLSMEPKRGNERLTSNAVKIGCLSPILSVVPLNKQNQSFSSTPIRKEAKVKENAKNTNYNFIDADLFEDWDIVDFNLEDRKKDENDFITMSQAFQMIDEAKKSRDEKNNLNESVNMLTGEVVQPHDELHSNGKENKPTAAQKLIFKTDIDPFRTVDDTDLGNICLSSDEDFDVFTQIFSVEANAEKGSTKHNAIQLSDDSINCNTKKGKKVRIIESDTTEDSPSPKIRRKFKKKNSNDSQGRQFLDTEAEVSDDAAEVSIDEIDHEPDEYEKSFVVEGSYFTQNCSTDMTAKYLESVKAIAGRPNGFKIPKAKPYIPDNVFSQMPEEPNTDYELDSFCVNDVEEETKTDLSELEIAEKILEMDRKKKKQKRGRSQAKRVK